jgi:anti-anti-sigma regulatory factor
MKFYLIVAKGPKKGMPIPITVDLFLIGSDKMCQLRKDTLGPKHCALVTRENKVFIRDFDSGKPTLVNGNLLPPGEEWPLHPGNRIEVENLEFMIQFRERPLSQKDLEEWAAHCLDHSSDHEMVSEEQDEFHKPTNASEAAQSIIDKLTLQKGLVKGRLRVGLDHGITTVRFNDVMLVDEGEITRVKRELCDNLSKPGLRVLLDCKNLRRLSTSAVNMFREVNSWLKPWGSSMALCRLRPELKGILGTLHLDKIPHFDDKSTALYGKW